MIFQLHSHVSESSEYFKKSDTSLLDYLEDPDAEVSEARSSERRHHSAQRQDDKTSDQVPQRSDHVKGRNVRDNTNSK